jgi:hypothetical protein
MAWPDRQARARARAVYYDTHRKSTRSYLRRAISARERKSLSSEIRGMAQACRNGRRIVLHVRNRTNMNGFQLINVGAEGTFRLKIERVLSKGWAEAHGYRW